MRGLLQKLLLKFVKGNWGKIIPPILTAIAEGKMGPVVKRVYWVVAGKKTFIGMVLVGLAYGLEAVCNNYGGAGWGCTASQWLVWIGGFLASVGLIDGGNRAPWPETPTGGAPWQEGK